MKTVKTVLLNEDWKDTWATDETGEESKELEKEFVSAFERYFSKEVGQPISVDFSLELLHQDSYETEDDFEPFDTEEPNKWDVAYTKTCRAFETGDVFK